MQRGSNNATLWFMWRGMTAIEKSYTEGLEGLEAEEIKLRKGKIQAKYQGNLPTSKTQKILQRNGLNSQLIRVKSK